MSKKHPTPWRLDFDDAYPEFTNAPIIDANGEPVVVTDSGVYPPDNETADEIVTAMNNQELFIKERREHIATIDQLRDALARTRDALSRANKYGMDADAENGKLRDLVRRMMPGVEEAYAIAQRMGKSIAGICALKGVDASEVDNVLAQWAGLLAEAREAIGEGNP